MQRKQPQVRDGLKLEGFLEEEIRMFRKTGGHVRQDWCRDIVRQKSQKQQQHGQRQSGVGNEYSVWEGVGRKDSRVTEREGQR